MQLLHFCWLRMKSFLVPLGVLVFRSTLNLALKCMWKLAKVRMLLGIPTSSNLPVLQDDERVVSDEEYSDDDEFFG